MRVLFIYPNLYTQMGFNHGLAALSARLLEQGHETELVNLNENLPPVPTREDVLERIRAWRPGLVAVSCLSQQYVAALELARWLRAAAPAAGVELPPLVVGGIHPTMVPSEVMADGAWDHVGVGECEDALAELALRVEAGETPDDVRNFLSWTGGRRPAAADAPPVDASLWVHNPVREFPDFAALPRPDYALFDTQRIVDKKHGWFGLMTSRGCPYRCTYCLNHRIIDRYRADLDKPASQVGFLRTRHPADVIDEMRWVLGRYENVGTFILDDDLFTQDEEHALAFCEAYRASGIGVPYVVNGHVKQLQPHVARALVESGCRILKLGIESGSERVRRRVLQRPMTDADILATVALAEHVGLHTSGFVMVGLPTETREERLETVELLARCGIGRFRTSLFYPFPGTESARLAFERGHVREDLRSLTDFTRSSCLDFGAEENLFVDKLATCMPWFVNARLDHWRAAPAARRYRPLVAELLALDEDAWRAFKPTVAERDGALSRAATEAGELHYAIRYNAFMGVRSDFFLAEDAGAEWLTAAARPVPRALERRALAAAADEVS